MKRLSSFSLVLASLLAAASLAACAQGVKLPVVAFDQSAVGQRGFFYVAGQYTGTDARTEMRGQMYVEVVAPKQVRHPYPLVLIHGNGQTATNWMGTPDGRKGWAEYFVEQGYVVYMVDQTMRGRSAWHPADGATQSLPVQQVELLFTASAQVGKWPQASRHTQWPGSGRRGDPVFDAFYATQVESLASSPETERAMQAAGAALLDRIGPAILVTHSGAGYFGWLIADRRPQLVKANVLLEPAGPPLESAVVASGRTRAWGLTNIPITYEPQLADPKDLATEKQAAPDRPEVVACWTQKEPARQLPNLKGIPSLVLVSEASYHAAYDHCTAKWMNQAGVKTDFVRLDELGIRGNGHMVMIEKNNVEIARVLDDWMRRNVR